MDKGTVCDHARRACGHVRILDMVTVANPVAIGWDQTSSEGW